MNKKIFFIFLKSAAVFLLIFLIFTLVIFEMSISGYKAEIKKTVSLETYRLNDQIVKAWTEYKTEDDIAKQIRLYDTLQEITDSLLEDNIYSYIEVYNKNDQLMAKSGNILKFYNLYTSGDYSLKPDIRVIHMDDYFSLDLINSLSEDMSDKYCMLEITGYEDGASVIPEQIKSFSSDTAGGYTVKDTFRFFPIDVNGLQSVKSDSERIAYLSFYRLDNEGPVTLEDRSMLFRCIDLTQKAKLGGKMSAAKSYYSEAGNSMVYEIGCFSSVKAYYVRDSSIINGMYFVMGVYTEPFEAVLAGSSNGFIWAILIFIVIYLIVTVLIAQLARKQYMLEENRKILTSSIAHELKTPLGIIHNCSEAIRERINREKEEEYLGIIIDQTEHMNSMIADMLMVSMMGRDSKKLKMERASLGEITEAALGAYERLFSEKQITAECRLPAASDIICDVRLTEKIISNYLSNAVRHTPRKGKITVTVRKCAKGFRLEVENTGNRIPGKSLKRIWLPFYKAESSSSGSGTGLGLSLVNRIIRLHGWRCGVRNTESGVCFWFQTK